MNNCKFSKKIFYTAITSVCILFIFIQSLLPAKTSSEESGKILEIFNYILDFFGIDFSFSSHFVRKLAHFFEFAVLGYSVYFTLNCYFIKQNTTYVFTPVSYIIVAVTDESLQLFSAGRASSMTDVLLDSFGGTFGFLLALIVYRLIKIRKKH